MIELSQDFITAREASNSLSQVLDRARTSPQVITRNGKPAAVVIDPELWDDLTHALELEAESLRILADAAAERADRGEGRTREAAQARLDAWAVRHGFPPFDPATLTIEQLAQYVDLEPDQSDAGR
jgi:prevent-host-death family protein